MTLTTLSSDERRRRVPFLTVLNARHPLPPDPGPLTPPPQQRRAPARHRTVPRPTAWDVRGSIVSGATAAQPRAAKPAGETISGSAAGHRGLAQPPAPAAQTLAMPILYISIHMFHAVRLKAANRLVCFSHARVACVRCLSLAPSHCCLTPRIK